MAASPRAHPHLRVLVFLQAHLCLVSALSFSYNFSIPGTSAQLRFINDSSPYSDRVDLTIRNKRNSTGRAFHPQPVRLWDRRTGKTASFNTSFSFAITNDPNISRFPGDGMAFFIGPFPATLPPGSVGSFLGLFNPYLNTDSSPPTVAVEFDTYWNSNWDPPDVARDHMGIDVNSIRSNVYTKDLRQGDLNGTMSANVNYNGSSMVMVVTLQLANGTTHSIQSTVDFRAARLPQDVAVGFSAATGACVENHQVLSWSFSSTDPTSNNKIPLWAIILLSAGASALAGLVAVVLCVIMRREQRRHRTDQIDLPVAREFSYNELSAATNNFSRRLGEGSFGEVYKGELQAPNKPPVEVAVKKLTSLLEQTRRDYVTEIKTLGELSHRNLVKLVGWCNGGGGSGGGRLLLVYELVTNRDLHEHLHESSERLLTWAERYKIVRGIGSAIEYLHTGCRKAILHRDIKPRNVFLDDKFEAKLGDFGLVRQVEPGQSSLGGTIMIGIRVYMDPVCTSDNTVSTASDVYSFGVLLLEIATGLKPEVQGLSNTLINAVQESYAKGEVLQMADQRLNGDFDKKQIERVLVVGLLCVQQQREHRPKIRNAVNLLSDLHHPVPQFLS